MIAAAKPIVGSVGFQDPMQLGILSRTEMDSVEILYGVNGVEK